jgi:alkyl sulfatase BDS1-like metallo-beta-lactamase superfamily hydrolase
MMKRNASVASVADVATGPRGQRAHAAQFEHAQRFEQRLWAVTPGVWCMVGNGLSNQTFVEAPDGIIAIDTGESTEEMAAALAALREHTDRPIAAVIYTHFHYVAGTAAIDDDEHLSGYPIWGHERICVNRERMGTEVGVTMRRGLVYQFGLTLPEDGPDGLVSAGLGPWFRNPAHAPFTDGFVPPTRTISTETSTTVAGLRVEITPAPSDADDSVTIWFPELGVCVNNLVWPALFNIYAIRGEEYRDPRVLLRGLDHVRSLNAEHLVGAHGPPLSGRDLIASEVTRARDAIQFIWDQTVRGLNHDLTSGELIEFVQLPACYDESYLTQQLYGLAEHHTRQVHTGLRGWFDGYEAELLPLPTAERCGRMIAGFGGHDEVRAQAGDALAADDLRWALELATWLVRCDIGPDGRADAGTADDRALLATVLRSIAQRTTSANIRNWCLTRARELDGLQDLSRLRRHRFAVAEVLAAEPDVFVHGLRVLLVPERAEGLDVHLTWEFEDEGRTGLHVRHCVAAPTDGEGGDHTIHLRRTTWAEVLAGKRTMADALAAGDVSVTGDASAVRAALGVFDHPSFSVEGATES